MNAYYNHLQAEIAQIKLQIRCISSLEKLLDELDHYLTVLTISLEAEQRHEYFDPKVRAELRTRIARLKSDFETANKL